MTRSKSRSFMSSSRASAVSTGDLAATVQLFGRHVDLTPLRGKRRGVVRCCFHDDSHASLSVDLESGLFNCFGCGERGGYRRFAELVGERDTARSSQSVRRHAGRSVASQAMHYFTRRAEWARWMRANDVLRLAAHAVRDARAAASRLGPASREASDLLERAASIERRADAIEAKLDAMLAHGQIG